MVVKATASERPLTSVSRMSDTTEHSVVDPRLHPIHWRFQELLMEHNALRRGDPQDMGDWALRVYQTVRELLDPQHEMVDVVEAIRHDLGALDFVPPGFRRQREINYRLKGPIRAQAYGAVLAAAVAERGDETVLRVVDMHPWVAEPAEPLYNDGHWFQAVTTAADNVRAQWKAILGVKSTKGLDLPSVFSESDPQPGKPRMRFACYDRNRDEDEWVNAHEGAMHFARGCIMRIRNLHKYQLGDQAISPGLALETLAALSRLARWITDAQVERA